MITSSDNLGRYGVKNDRAYQARVGFNQLGDTCVKWCRVTGHKGAQIVSNFNRYGGTYQGHPILAINHT